MRIGVNCHLLQPDIGGIRQYFFNLFNELLVTDRENEYIFFYFEHNVEELEKLQTDCWKSKSVKLGLPKEIYNHISKIDLYFCPFSTLSPRPLPMPTVYTIPDIQEVFYPQFFSSYLKVARAYHYVGSSKMSDRIITHSIFSKNTLVKYHGIKDEKVLVAHHSVDNIFYSSDRPGNLSDFNLPARYVFFPANRWLHKNHDLLLRAILWLKEEKDIFVNVVFTGFDNEDGYPLQKKVEEYGVSSQVHQLGYVTVEQMVMLYAKAEMLVFPSLFEGFGIPVVEAMAAGCPVLAARTTSLPEIGGDAARYFDPSSCKDLGRAIVELMENESLRKELIAKGKERAKLFSASGAAQKHLEAFTEAYRSYSKIRYYWHRFIYKYYHASKIIFMADYYLWLFEILRRKIDKLVALMRRDS